MTASPVGEEAARLLEALHDWFAGGAGGLPLATDAAECQLCPLCRLLSVLRGTRPEVFGHLTDAATALLAALRAAIDAHERSWAARPPSPVQHIDIAD
ncbi:MAG: DUF5304 family protein [Mycobacteriales bacterium]